MAGALGVAAESLLGPPVDQEAEKRPRGRPRKLAA
jgi:hypothetical protein